MRVDNEIPNRFSSHPETGEKAKFHDEVRENHLALALWIETAIPDSRERSLALTALQESMMWCNAAVAYRMKGDSDGSE